MNVIRKFSMLRALALMVMALGLSNSVAAAQTAVGSFKLPMEAHWERAVLPAGEYSFKVETEAGFTLVTVRSEDGKWGAMFPVRFQTQTPDSEDRGLVLTRRGEDFFVTSLQLGDLGLVLGYNIPKTVEARSIAALTRAPGATVLAH